MHTVILPPRFSADTQRIWRAATAVGWPVVRAASSWRIPDDLVGADCVVYGEELFAQAIAQQLGRTLADPPEDWLARLPDDLVGRRVASMPLSQAHRGSRPAFIKPAGAKTFPARVYGSPDQPHSLPTVEELGSDPLVLVSEVVRWRTEFRCFCITGTAQEPDVVTASVYLCDGQLAWDGDDNWPASADEMAQARELAVRALNVGPALPPFVVIDVGVFQHPDTGTLTPGVIEANPAYASGLYGCDAATVLQHLTRQWI